MRTRALSLVLLAVVVCSGCLGGLGGGVAEVVVPPEPERPETLTDESVAVYANASETHRLSREYADRATDLHVTCRPSTAGVVDGTGYAYVECGGGFQSESVEGEIRSTAVYRVTENETVRVADPRLVAIDESTETSDRDDYRRLRVFTLAADPVALSVDLSAEATSNESVTHDYRLDPRSGAWSELGDSLSTAAVRVTASLDTGERLTTNWTSDGRLSSDDLAGIVVVTTEGELLWTTASW